MSSIENETVRSPLLRSIRRHWVLFLIEGIVLVVFGAIAVVLPGIAALAVTILLGWLFLFSGILGLATTIWLRQLPGVPAAGERMGAMASERGDLIWAIELALAGDWQASHRIVQQDEADATACWIHAVLHKIEGDAGNARYWYRRAGQSYEAYTDAKAELAAIKASLTY